MAKAVEIFSLEFQWDVADNWSLKVKDLSVESGEKVFLHGPSGSGKTTLLDLLTGIHTQKKGSIKLLGKELGEFSAKQRDQFRADHIGFIFQQFNLLPYLNVIDNVLISCHFSKLRYRKANGTGSIKKSAHDLLSALGINSELHTKLALQLSVGQQQRVAIARSLIGNPEIIIADEPTSSLDKDARDAFIELLLKQVKQSDSTLIFVSHDRELANFFDKSISISELE